MIREQFLSINKINYYGRQNKKLSIKDFFANN